VYRYFLKRRCERFLAKICLMIVSLAIVSQCQSPKCSQLVAAGYSIQFPSHVYRVTTFGPAGPNQLHVFFDENDNQVTDPSVLQQLASGAWTHDNVIVPPDARNGASLVTSLIQTSVQIETYTTVQELLARSMAEALKAAATGGVTASEAVENLTVGMLKSELLSSPRSFLILSAREGLTASLNAYSQMLAVPFPASNATVFRIEDLNAIKGFYLQAYALYLPNSALAAKLMPNASQMTDQALTSFIGQLFTVTPGFSAANDNQVLTLRSLLTLQKGIANLGTGLTALQDYSQDLNLVLNLANAEQRTISQLAIAAANSCIGPDGRPLIPAQVNSNSDPSVPDAIQTALTKSYPGWSFVKTYNPSETRGVCPLVKSPFPPYFISGDFDGDGKTDYAALISYAGKGIVVVFLARGAGFQAFPVFSTPYIPDTLMVLPAGWTYKDSSPKHFGTLALASVGIFGCEHGAIAFTYRRGAFVEVDTGE